MTKLGLPGTKRTFVALAAAALAAACSDAPTPVTPASPPEEGAVANRNRAPAARDTNWVVTPAGLYPRECVHEVPNGAYVSRSGRVTRRDGSTFQLPWCAPRGKAAPGPGVEVKPPVTNGWVEYASYIPGGNFKRLQGFWFVPPAPTGAFSAGQVYYTFPGIMSSQYIIQPVLQYYNTGAGGTKWTMASWHCSSDPSNCTHSTIMDVSAGHIMFGSVVASNCVSGTCTWTITTRDETSHTTTTHSVQDTENYYWAVGGAVEVYELGSCSQYPSKGVSYSNMYLENSAGQQVTPTWSSTVYTVDPSCGFGTSTTSATVNLCHNSGMIATPVFTNPSPAVQYLPYSITMNGCGFDPSTVQMQVIGTTPNSSCPTACTPNSFSSKTPTQVVAYPFSLSLPGTYAVYVRNGPSGVWAGGGTITVRSMY